jgi:hypothetical protein
MNSLSCTGGEAAWAAAAGGEPSRGPPHQHPCSGALQVALRFKCVSKPWLALCSSRDIRKRSPQTLCGFFYYHVDDIKFRNLSGRGLPLVDPSLPFLRESYKRTRPLRAPCRATLPNYVRLWPRTQTRILRQSDKCFLHAYTDVIVTVSSTLHLIWWYIVSRSTNFFYKGLYII